MKLVKILAASSVASGGVKEKGRNQREVSITSPPLIRLQERESALGPGLRLLLQLEVLLHIGRQCFASERREEKSLILYIILIQC